MASPSEGLEIRRTGGVAGIALTVRLPLCEVSEAELAAVRALPRGRPQPSGPDRFQYDLALQQGCERREVSVQEQDLPPLLRPLIDRAIARARGGPG